MNRSIEEREAWDAAAPESSASLHVVQPAVNL